MVLQVTVSCLHFQINIYIDINTYIHTYIHTYIQTLKMVVVRRRKLCNVYILQVTVSAYTKNTYIHTYIHTYIKNGSCATETENRALYGWGFETKAYKLIEYETYPSGDPISRHAHHYYNYYYYYYHYHYHYYD
jgi:hypothetical protein